MTTETFAGFGFADPLNRALDRAGFITPTPIQTLAIPPQLDGRDILGVARTGSGKTAAFGLPILHQILGTHIKRSPRTARALILAPTRELAVQIQENLRLYCAGTHLAIALVLGGVSKGPQIKALSRGVDVLVATPGRLTDLMSDGHVRLDESRWVVLDEADRMLDMGFAPAVKQITSALHPRRQTALFSATMPKEVEALAQSLLNEPVRIDIAPEGGAAPDIDQRLERVDRQGKRKRLAAILSSADVSRVIVFARTKRGADRVAKNLVKDGITADAIHGDKAQNARQRALNGFKSGRTPVLVATDIAARGIDVDAISHVINYDLPDEPENYVHRIGRTGRNGATGASITLCDSEEADKLRAIERLLGRCFTADGALGDEAPSSTGPAPGGRAAKRRRRRGKPASAAQAPSPASRESANRKPKPQRRRRRSGGGGAGAAKTGTR